MANTNIPQRERSQNNPLNLGTFSTTSLRMLKGSLGAKNEIITGGYGRETYNHWFQVTLASEAWIILFKASSALTTGNSTLSTRKSPLTTRYSISVYDQNKNPIQGRNIFQADSALVSASRDGFHTSFSNSYTGQVMAAQSDLYNTSSATRADEGDDRYFPLGAGNYLICVSAERNEAFQYGVGLVVEFQTPQDELFFLCEDTSEITYLITENDLNSAVVEFVPNTVTSGITLSTLNGFTEDLCTIVDPNGVVQVDYANTDGNPLSWLIGPDPGDIAIGRVLLDATENWIDTTHEHSLTQWKEAWQRDHSMDDKFPAIFATYTNVA
ncbi:MAG: hypothetical protein Unbinned3459contig1000_74 [Prokaryotic dsDNA virus sp.]|jgi:hypothetical protein|nr:MAG: hypothetical protein Unbinned3459contig1000_74 [Prokaryotic dsDNA virus sp.]|tara:strand:- start:78070 stop:79047 length:978 start_codon:yes stop_codon:yes gene_type:complete